MRYNWRMAYGVWRMAYGQYYALQCLRSHLNFPSLPALSQHLITEHTILNGTGGKPP